MQRVPHGLVCRCLPSLTPSRTPAPQSNGDEGRYWRVLSDAGITRQRLESFDRPIRQPPHFYGDKKVPGRLRHTKASAHRTLPVQHALLPFTPTSSGAACCGACARPYLVCTFTRSRQDALIREFRNYLGILKAVHSGADLTASAAAVGSSLPQGARGYLGYVTSHIGDSQASDAWHASQSWCPAPGCTPCSALAVTGCMGAFSLAAKGMGSAPATHCAHPSAPRRSCPSSRRQLRPALRLRTR